MSIRQPAGATPLSALDLNKIRISTKHTVLAPELIKSMSDKSDKSASQKSQNT